MRSGAISTTFMRTFAGLPFYVAHTAPTDESSPIAFERNFNPDLRHDSEYFNSLHKFLGCVDRNSGKGLSEDEQNQVCRQEFRAMRE